MDSRTLASSRTHATKHFVEGESDPLEFLLPWEQRAAEIYVELSMAPVGEGAWRLGSANVTEFLARIKEEFKVDLPKWQRPALHGNPAWRDYVRQLRSDARGQALKKLKRKATKAVDTYLWAQDTARKEGDYKEARVAAGDHLDRIGATEKPNVQPVQAIQIVVKSRNVDLANPFKELPAVEVEESPLEGTPGKLGSGGT